MGAIDADAHVIETVQTWSYLEDGRATFHATTDDPDLRVGPSQ